MPEPCGGVRLAGVPGFRTRLRYALAMLETLFDVVLRLPPGDRTPDDARHDRGPPLRHSTEVRALLAAPVERCG